MGLLADAVRGVILGEWPSRDATLARLFGGPPVLSGVTVNEETALNLSAVWAAVSVIAGDVGALPLIFYKRLSDGGKERYDDHPLYRLVHDAPNPEMSTPVFLETLQQHVLLWGNGFAEITRDRSGRAAALWPIEPWRVQAFRDEGGRLRYRIAAMSASVGGPSGFGMQTITKDAILAPDEVLHVPGLTPNGVWGYSVVRKARESLGLSIATEKFGAAFFGNGARPSGILEHPSRLSDTSRQNLRESWRALHEGPANAHKIAILEEGMKFHQLSIPPEDAQFLSTRQFQTVEIARWFGIPPHKLGDLSRATFSNIEHQAIEYVMYTLRRWLVRWEREITRKLVAPLERNHQFFEFVVDALLRGDTDSRYRAYAVAHNNGWLSVNDIRRLENMNPIGASGDLYLVQQNMIPLDQLVTFMQAKANLMAAKATQQPAADVKTDDTTRAFLDAAMLRLDDLGRRVEAIVVPTGAQLAEVLRVDLAATEERVGQVADMFRAHAANADAEARALMARLETLAAEVAAMEQGQRGRFSEMRDELVEQERCASERAEGMRRAVVLAVEQFATDQATTAEIYRDVVEQIRARETETAERLAVLAQEQAALRERLEATEAERRAQAERLAAIAPGVRDVIVAAVRKEARFEGDRARKAAQNPEKLRAWMESFYAGREESSVQFLLPSMRLYYTLAGRQDAEAETRRLIGGYVADSRAALEAALEGDEATLEERIAALAMRWETERPAVIADELMREVISDGA